MLEFVLPLFHAVFEYCPIPSCNSATNTVATVRNGDSKLCSQAELKVKAWGSWRILAEPGSAGFWPSLAQELYSSAQLGPFADLDGGDGGHNTSVKILRYLF